MKKYTAVLMLLVSITRVYGAPDLKLKKALSPFMMEPVELLEEDAHCGGFGGPIDKRYGVLRLRPDLKKNDNFDEQEEAEDDKKYASEVEALFASQRGLPLDIGNQIVKGKEILNRFQEILSNRFIRNQDGVRVEKNIEICRKKPWKPDLYVGEIVNARDATNSTVLDAMVSRSLTRYDNDDRDEWFYRHIDISKRQRVLSLKTCILRSRLEPLVQLLRAGGLPAIENPEAVARVQRIFRDFMIPSLQRVVLSRCNRAYEAQLMPGVLQENILALPSAIYDLIAGYLDDLIMVESDSEKIKEIKRGKYAAFAWQRKFLGGQIDPDMVD